MYPKFFGMFLSFVILLSSLVILSAAKDLHAQTPDFSHLESEGRHIRDTLHNLLLKTQNPNTLGVQALSPQEFKQEVENTEARLVAWKNELSAIVNGAFSAEVKAKIISSYFTQCSILVQVRILGGEKFPVDEPWQKKFSFPITVQALYELSGDSPLNLATAPESPVNLDIELETLKHLEPTTLLPLQFSSFHIQAMRQMVLSNEVIPQNYFSLVQSLMVGWLLESLEKTQLLMSGTKRTVPSLKGFEEIQKNLKLKTDMIREKMNRELLIKNIPDIPLFFADDSWIQKLISLLLAPEFYKEYFKIYQEGFQKSEPIDVKETFAMIAHGYPLPMAHLSLAEKMTLLRKWYVQARFSVVLALMPESKDWTEETKTAIINLLQERLKEYEAFLPPDPFKTWTSTSELNGTHQEILRKDYYIKLIEISKKLKEQIALPKDQLPLDLITLDMALEKDFLMMGVEPATLQRKMGVVQSSSLEEARMMYQALLKELQTSVQNTPKPQGHSLSEKVQAKAYEKLEKELQEFLKVGEWFFGNQLTDIQKESYQEIVKIRVTGEHHILTVVGGLEESPLYERLARLDPMNADNMAMGGSWIEEALTKIEEETIEKIDTVAQAKSIEDIQTIVAKSPLLHVMISQYPTFMDYHEKLKKRIVSPSFAEMSWDELFHQTTYPGFTFLLLHWVAKFVPGVRTHPLMRAIDMAISPYLSYFLISAFSMVGVNAVWQYERIENQEEDIEILRDYLETSAGDDSFADLLTTTRAQDERDMMWGQWKMDRAFDFGFLVGIPVLGKYGKQAMGMLRDRHYGKLFEKVGFSQGRVNWSEGEIRQISRATCERIKQDHPSNQKLQKWLTAQVQEAEQKLLRIIQRAEKSMQRKTKHFREEFEALRMEEGEWDPVEIITSLERMKALHQEKLISQEALDKALRAAQALLREVRIPFLGLNRNGATAELQRRLIFMRNMSGTKGSGTTVWLDEAAKYVDGDMPLDPVLERDVQTIKDPDGHEIEIISYKRVSPYVARKVWPPFRGQP